MKKLVVGFWCLLVGVMAPLPGAAAEPTPQRDPLNELIAHRLSFMADVAAWKWVNGKAIEDKAREVIVLNAARQAAEQFGLDGPSTTGFFVAQMEAAKYIQQQHFDQWQTEGPGHVAPPDLQAVLRPAINKAGDNLLAHISLTLPSISDAAEEDLAADLPLPALHVSAIARGLQQIRYLSAIEDNRFAEIVRRGTLYVGTTGDYAPFSTGSAGDRSGIDIDLANSLATYLGLDLVFKETSWPGLLEDLENQTYDIGMSGISIMPFRREVGHLSDPYHTGGKALIIRCADKAHLNSLAAIDQPGVQIVVNPGGTNERYTRANIHDADITIFGDNTLIFDEIAAGRADAMITDAIEVAYQTARNPELCPAMPGQTLTTSQKGFLMPQDDLLLLHVNRWLKGITEDGSLQRTFDAHLKVPHQSTP